MKIQGIETDSMLNGDGLRTVLWVSGCEHHCKNCQNPQTWDENSGYDFTIKELLILEQELEKDYISGITYSGGDPLHPKNRETVTELARRFWSMFFDKTQWLYTGYHWEQIKDFPIMKYLDVVVDGEFREDLADVNFPWAGSTNQRVIDVKKSLKENRIVLHEVEEKNLYASDRG